jgi:hypothetical protein
MEPVEGRWRRLADLLRQRASDFGEWSRTDDYCFQIGAPTGDRTLRVVLLQDGDLQVEYHVEKPGSPFEHLFVIPESEEAAALEEVASFVSDLLRERLVLADPKWWHPSSRREYRPEEVNDEVRRRVNWISSLRCTYDWP